MSGDQKRGMAQRVMAWAALQANGLRRPVDEDASPLDSAPPLGSARAALRSGTPGCVEDGLETSLRPEPEPNRLGQLRSGGAGNRNLLTVNG